MYSYKAIHKIIKRRQVDIVEGNDHFDYSQWEAVFSIIYITGNELAKEDANAIRRNTKIHKMELLRGDIKKYLRLIVVTVEREMSKIYKGRFFAKLLEILWVVNEYEKEIKEENMYYDVFVVQGEKP